MVSCCPSGIKERRCYMARLPQGVRKRTDGTLEKRFTVDGKRYSIYGVNNKELQQKEKEVRRQIEAGLYTENRNITLNEYFDEWEHNRRRIVKASTEKSTRMRYEKHIQPILGNKRIQKIEKREIIMLQQSLSQTHKSSVVNLIMCNLKSILKGAVEDEIIAKNPAATVKPLRTDGDPKATETIHRALTKEEQEAFLQEGREDWLYEFFCFSLCTGMRILEIGALEWRDIDYINNVIHVNKTLSLTQAHEYTVTSPKSEASKRDIPMNETIKKILMNQKKKMLMVFGGSSVRLESRIFVTSTGKVINAANFLNVMKRILRELDKKDIHIERFSHHAFRDTFATRYIEHGGNMQTLKTILGHSTLAMTADLYAHVLPDTKQKEMNLIEKGFEGVV